MANIRLRYDRDGDGMTDVWEYAHGLDLYDPYDAGHEAGNGLTNLQTYRRALAAAGGTGTGTGGTGTGSGSTGNGGWGTGIGGSGSAGGGTGAIRATGGGVGSSLPSAGSGPDDDDDYDRIPNSQETTDGRPSHVDWALTLLENVDSSTLNELGQFVRVVADSEGIWKIEEWDAGEWKASGQLGDGGVPGSEARAAQNNAGTVAAIIAAPGGGYELRILDGNENFHSVALSDAVGEPVLGGVTDSGFVFGTFSAAQNVASAFRWRAGQLSVYQLSPGSVAQADGNEAGYLFANIQTPAGAIRGMLFNRGVWTDVGGPVLALNNRGQAIIAQSGSAYWWEDGVSTQLGISLGGRARVVLNDTGQMVFSPAPGETAPASTIFRDRPRALSLVLADPALGGNTPRSVVVNSINDVGEVVGYFAGATPSLNEAFSWRGGEFSIDGIDLPLGGTEFVQITNSGHILACGTPDNENPESDWIAILSPLNDSDGDLMPDDWERFFGCGDPDEDEDGDGLSNLAEYLYFTSPINRDSDGDGMPDGWEISNGHDPRWLQDAAKDFDGDRLKARDERRMGTDPLVPDPDMDGDGMIDAWEQRIIDANLVDGIRTLADVLRDDDFDGDGVSNYAEFADDRNPLGDDLDSDGDSLPDVWESIIYSAENDGLFTVAHVKGEDDFDGDGVSNLDEFLVGLNPVDSDRDGIPDRWERVIGTDPTRPDTDYDGLSDQVETNSWPAAFFQAIPRNGSARTWFGRDYRPSDFPVTPRYTYQLVREGGRLMDSIAVTNPGEADESVVGSQYWAATPSAMNPLLPDTNQNGLPDGYERDRSSLAFLSPDGVPWPQEYHSGCHVASRYDSDGDGFQDHVEIAAGSSPHDPAAVPAPGFVLPPIIPPSPAPFPTYEAWSNPYHDDDYDRIPNCAEPSGGTTGGAWSSYEIPSPFPDQYQSLSPAVMESLNDLGELVAVKAGSSNGEVRVFRLGLNGGSWLPLSSLGASFQYAKQNNRGLRAFWNSSGGAFRLLNASGSVSVVSLPAGSRDLTVHDVTDSGFVYGSFNLAYPGTDVLRHVFRHRNGRTEILGRPQGLIWVELASGSERGEMALLGSSAWLSVDGGPGAAMAKPPLLTPDGHRIDLAPIGFPSYNPWAPFPGNRRALVNHSGYVAFRNWNMEFNETAPLLIAGRVKTLIAMPPMGNGDLPEYVEVTSLNRNGDVGGYTRYDDYTSGGYYSGMRAFIWRAGGVTILPGIAPRVLACNNAGWLSLTDSWTEEVDSDQDGVADGTETRTSNRILVPANEAAGSRNFLPDDWERRFFQSPGQNAGGDPDGDGVTSRDEYAFGTNPRLADTDGDGIDDRFEIDAGMDPLRNDAGEDVDGDGRSWAEEFQKHSGPYDSRNDADQDGMSDDWEYAHGLNLLDPADATTDSDSDGVSNLAEFLRGTDPFDGTGPVITLLEPADAVPM
ncbi:MAG: hypothetical protein KGS60_19025 [Verrucomicrobia bacterium]|nr:hypothetical protein [Verrucomicrobiota bacterium]